MWAGYKLGISVLWTVHIISLISTTKVFASGGGVFELRLHHFLNDDGLNADGNCCNGVRSSGSCTSACQTFFRICLKHYQTEISPDPPCTFGQLTTDVIGDNTFDFPTSFGNIRLPFSFLWPGTFSLIIEAWHDTTLSQPRQGSPRELISRLATQRSVEVGDTWSHDVHKTANTELKYSYRVICDQDYFGGDCSKLCRPRDDNFGHYTCADDGTKQCLEGWQGDYCDKAMCLPGCHSQHGHCDLPNECKCHIGWEGQLCNQCIVYPGCQHGSCSQPWECNCDEGWGGLFCNQDLNFCTHHKPCRNGATCTNSGPGSYTCECLPGFQGTNCEIEVDDCQQRSCLNGGSCQSTAGSDYQCLCPRGYHGRRCESSATSCADLPCENEATCSATRDGYLCRCPVGFTGVNCEIQLDECSSNPCLHGGRCVDELAGYRCQCSPGYHGQRCEVNVNNCINRPCLNGGTCEDDVNQFICRCVTGFVGDLCQEDVNECEYLPCANGGTCHDLVNDFTCDCPAEFTGKDCRDKVDVCLSQPCKNGATCEAGDALGYYRCLCLGDFYGLDCEHSLGGVGRSDVPPSRGAGGTTVYPGGSSSHAAAGGAGGGPEVNARSDNVTIKDESVITMQQLLLITCLGVGIPILIIVGIIVFLLINRRRSQHHHQHDDTIRKENEHNEVTNMNNKNKCLDTNIIHAIPPNNASLKITNEEQDSSYKSSQQQTATKNHNQYYIEKPSNINKNINTELERHCRSRTLDVLAYDRDLKKQLPSSSKVLDSGMPTIAEKDYSDSLDSSVVDVSEYTSQREVPADVHHPHPHLVKSLNTEANSNSIFVLDRHHSHPYNEGMLATEV